MIPCEICLSAYFLFKIVLCSLFWIIFSVIPIYNYDIFYKDLVWNKDIHTRSQSIYFHMFNTTSLHFTSLHFLFTSRRPQFQNSQFHRCHIPFWWHSLTPLNLVECTCYVCTTENSIINKKKKTPTIQSNFNQTTEAKGSLR